MDLQQLLERYHETLVNMRAARVESGGNLRQWNDLVNRMQFLHLQLRETQEGRDGITTYVSDDNETVRRWSATNALAWAPEVARPALEEIAGEDRTLSGFEARITLREFDAGRLDTTWKPKGRGAHTRD